MGSGCCARCGKHTLVGPLHLENGGPLFCIPCGTAFHAELARKRKQDKRIYEALLGGLQHAQDDELCLELLEDAIRLTHPDRHPPEREKLAQRVTAELLALKPFVRPRPPPSNASDLVPPRNIGISVTPRNTSKEEHGEPISKPSPPSYPCDVCRMTVPYYYCDPCKEKHDAECKARRDKEREQRKRYQERARQRREWRKPNLTCPSCGAQFKGRRKDAKFCSPKCRQKAHRNRHREGGLLEAAA